MSYSVVDKNNSVVDNVESKYSVVDKPTNKYLSN